MDDHFSPAHLRETWLNGAFPDRVFGEGCPLNIAKRRPEYGNVFRRVWAWRPAANQDRPQHVAWPRWSEYARRVRLATRCEPGRFAVRWTTDCGRSASAARGRAEVV